MSEQQAFGTWLKLRRKALDLTRESLADRVGCSAATIRKIEAEERRPSVQIAELFAAVFNIPPGERPAFIKYARGDGRFAPAGTIREAAWRSVSAPLPSNLPVPLTSFIGREKEVEEVVRLLRDHRLVVLTGPGGMGKTRLAIESAGKAANRFRDGVAWVDLVGLNDPSLVPQAAAQAVGAHGADNRPLVEALVERLQLMEILLVLDNCEHLIVACAQFADRLLSACKDLKILATSREPLNIPGETAQPMTALSLPERHGPFNAKNASQFESVRLFTERASSARSGFELGDQTSNAVVEICRQLDGMPLAIELAAARAKIISINEIAERLVDRFGLLTSGSRMAPSRHQTLRATIDWSHDLLTDLERILFRRVAVFVGGFTLQAAEFVCSEGIKQSDTLGLLGRLIDKSLVTVEQVSATGETRYRLLETIRQYALEKLEAAGEMIVTRDHHLTYLIQLAEQSEPHIWGSDVASWGKRLNVELDNFRAAMDWAIETGKAAGALRMTGSLVYYWLVHGDLLAEWHSRIQRALSSPGGMEPTLARAQALNAIGFFSWADLYLLDKRPELEEALHIGRKLGDQWTVACALRNLGLNATMRGSYVEARTLLEESLEIWRAMRAELKVRIGSSLTLLYLGDVAMQQEEPAFARSLLEECVQILRKEGEKNYLAYAVRRLALLAARQGDYQRAAALTSESLGLNSEIGDPRGVVASLAGFGGIAAARGNHERAARLLAAVGFHLNAAGVQLLHMDKIECEANLALVHGELDEKTLAKCWEEGRAMTLEQAIQYALEGMK